MPTPSRFGGMSGASSLTPSRSVAQNLRRSYVNSRPRPSTSGRFVERAPPERLPGDKDLLMDAAHFGATQPAELAELPFATANVVSRVLTGTHGRGSGAGPLAGAKPAPPQKGAVDAVTAAIGKIGIPNPFALKEDRKFLSVEGLIHVAGKSYERGASFASAIINSKDVEAIKYIENHRLADDDIVPQFFTANGMIPWATGNRAGGITVKEYYGTLDKRGFFTDVDEETGEARYVSPGEIVTQAEAKDKEFLGFGSFMHGDKALDENAAMNMLAKLGTDPTMYLMGAGVPVKVAGWGAAKIGGMSRWALSPSYRVGSRANAVSGLTSGVPEATWGVGYQSEMVSLGLRSSKYQSTTQAAQAFAQGNTSAATYKGLGLVLRGVRSGLGAAYIPGKAGAGVAGSLSFRYTRGMIQQKLGMMAAQGVSGAGQDLLGPDVPILSGIMSTVHDLSESILNDHPLSQDQLFVLMTAFNMPALPVLAAGVKGGKGFLHSKVGEGDTALWARQEGWYDPAAIKAPVVRWQERGLQREESFFNIIGDGEGAVVGKARAAKLLDHLNMHIAWNRLTLDPQFKVWAKSIDQATGELGPVYSVVRTHADELIASGKINAKDRIKEFKGWINDRVVSWTDETGASQRMDFKGDYGLSPRDMLREWAQWDRANTQIAESIGPLRGVILGRAQNIYRGGADLLISSLDDIAKDGKVSSEWVISNFNDNPGMFTDMHIPADTRIFFQTVMNRGVASGRGIYGKGRLQYDAAIVREHLVIMRDKLPEGREMFHEANKAEAGAIHDVGTPGGLVQPGGVARSWNAREITEHQVRSTAQGRTAKKELAALEKEYNAKWTKRGNLRKGRTLTVQPHTFKAERNDAGALEPAAVAKEHMSALEAATADKRYVYHRTYPTRLDSIRESGLTPSGGVRRKAPKEGNPVFFSDGSKIIALTNHLIGDTIILRTTKSRAGRPSAHKALADMGEFHRRSAVSPEALEILGKDGKWHPVKETVIEGERPIITETFNEIREGERLAITSKRGELDAIRAESVRLREMAKELGYIDFESHPTFRGRNGRSSVAREDRGLIYAQTKYVDEMYPAKFEVKKTPDVHMPWDVSDGAIGALFQQRTNLGRILYDYGPIARFTQFIDYLTEPRSAQANLRDANAMLENTLMRMGATHEGGVTGKGQVGEFIADMTESRVRGPSVGPMKMAQIKDIASLHSSQIQQSFDKVFGPDAITGSPGNVMVLEALKKQYNGHAVRVIDNAANSLARKVEMSWLKGLDQSKPETWSGHSMLTEMVGNVYRGYQVLPGLPGVTRMASKTLYPLFRFSTSIRWQAQNWIENRILAYFQDGIKSTKGRYKEGDDLAINSYELAQARAYGMPSPRMTGDLPPTAKGGEFEPPGLAETGAYTGRFMEPVMQRQYEFRSDKDIQNAVNDLAARDPALQWMEQRWGPNPKDYYGNLEEMLYGWDKNGVRATTQQEATRIAQQDRWTPEEIAVMQPFLNRITQRHAETYADIVHLHVGNTARSRVERLMNSYWLYWPLSYQIKTTKWMVGLMTNRMGGKQTNLGGAYLLDHGREIIMRELARNPAMQQEFEDNEALFMTMSMVLPATAWDHGVSLSRIPRYVGGNVLHFWDAYANLDNPGDYARKAMELGSYYDASLFSRVWGDAEESVDSQPEPDSLSGYRSAPR